MLTCGKCNTLNKPHKWTTSATPVTGWRKNASLPRMCSLDGFFILLLRADAFAGAVFIFSSRACFCNGEQWAWYFLRTLFLSTSCIWPYDPWIVTTALAIVECRIKNVSRHNRYGWTGYSNLLFKFYFMRFSWAYLTISGAVATFYKSF